MPQRPLLAPVFATLAFAACNTPTTSTPADTSLLVAKFSNEQGGPPAEYAAIASARHVSTVKVAGGAADVEVRLDTIDAPTGGKYIAGVELVAKSSGDGQLTAEVPAGIQPINRGTNETPVASLTLMVTWKKDTRTSASTRQTPIEIAGDGTVTAR